MSISSRRTEDSRRGRGLADPPRDIVEKRKEEIVTFARHFMDDLAGTFAGEARTFDYVVPAERERMLAAVRPFLEGGNRLRSDFGQHMSVTVLSDDGHADFVRHDHQLEIVLSLSDTSLWETGDGGRVRTKRQRVTIQLRTDAGPREIHTVRFATDAGA